MVFYTADLHLGYEPIIEKTKRPFTTIEEMDEALIKNWNETVSDEDTVYIVGDFSINHGPVPASYLSRLKGKKHLIRGNHDTGLDNQEDFFEYVESVTDFLEIDDGIYHITLCHYPVIYWQKGYMIHGHLHNTKMKGYQILEQLSRVLNAGVDVNHFRPVTLQQLIENNREFYNDPERGSDEAYFKNAQPHFGRGWSADFRPLPVKKIVNSKEYMLMEPF